MKPIFVRESGAGYLLAGLAVVSALLLSLDASTGLLKTTRSYLESFVSPVYLVAESPYLLGSEVDEMFSSRTSLQEQNQALARENLELRHLSQQFAALKAENDHLRQLLRSQGRRAHQVLIAEVVGIVPRPERFEMVIDKGSEAGLTVGQAVLDAHGLVGQLVSVGTYTSRVLVLTDVNHAVPVRVNRNGIRSIAGGTGEPFLQLENIPVSADIVEGDSVETSGLAGRFPAGYPVGRVISVVVESTSAYAEVVVQPLAQLDRSRHLLVIFNDPVEVAQ